MTKSRDPETKRERRLRREVEQDATNFGKEIRQAMEENRARGIVNTENLDFIRLDTDGRLYLNERHVGWVDYEEPSRPIFGYAWIRWRARTAEGPSLGVYPTRAAAEHAVLTAK